MKLKSVKDLYLLKRTLLKLDDKELSSKAIQFINKVLLAEGGSKAVLYPYNDLEETILQLWGEAMCPKDIAKKIGLGEDGEEIVLCVIEDQSNYEEKDGS